MNIEHASIRDLMDELASRSQAILCAALVPEDGQNHYVLTKWTGPAIVACGMLRAMQLEIDHALKTDCTSGPEPDKDADDE